MGWIAIRGRSNEMQYNVCLSVSTQFCDNLHSQFQKRRFLWSFGRVFDWHLGDWLSWITNILDERKDYFKNIYTVFLCAICYIISGIFSHEQIMIVHILYKLMHLLLLLIHFQLAIFYEDKSLHGEKTF